MTGWYIVAGIIAFIVFLYYRSTTLPIGYTVSSQSPERQYYDKLCLRSPNGEVVFCTSYVDIYGYRHCYLQCVRAARIHARNNKVKVVSDE